MEQKHSDVGETDPAFLRKLQEKTYMKVRACMGAEEADSSSLAPFRPKFRED